MQKQKKGIIGKTKPMNISNGNGSSKTNPVDAEDLTLPTFTKRDDTTLFGGLCRQVIKNLEKPRIVTSWEEILALEPGTAVEYLPLNSD